MSKLLTFLTTATTIAMAAVPLSAIGSVAHAGQIVPAAHIQVADLNLANHGDAVEFVTRVDHAAFRLCRFAGKPLDLQANCKAAVRWEAVELLSDTQRQNLMYAQGDTIRNSWRMAAL